MDAVALRLAPDKTRPTTSTGGSGRSTGGSGKSPEEEPGYLFFCARPARRGAAQQLDGLCGGVEEGQNDDQPGKACCLGAINTLEADVGCYELARGSLSVRLVPIDVMEP